MTRIIESALPTEVQQPAPAAVDAADESDADADDDAGKEPDVLLKRGHTGTVQLLFIEALAESKPYSKAVLKALEKSYDCLDLLRVWTLEAVGPRATSPLQRQRRVLALTRSPSRALLAGSPRQPHCVRPALGTSPHRSRRRTAPHRRGALRRRNRDVCPIGVHRTGHPRHNRAAAGLPSVRPVLHRAREGRILHANGSLPAEAHLRHGQDGGRCSRAPEGTCNHSDLARPLLNRCHALTEVFAQLTANRLPSTCCWLASAHVQRISPTINSQSARTRGVIRAGHTRMLRRCTCRRSLG